MATPQRRAVEQVPQLRPQLLAHHSRWDVGAGRRAEGVEHREQRAEPAQEGHSCAGAREDVARCEQVGGVGARVGCPRGPDNEVEDARQLVAVRLQ